MRRFVLAAAVAAATGSLALTPAFASSTYTGDAGVRSIGVDISGLTLDQSGVAKFMGTLSPDARKAVESACRTYSAPVNPADPQTKLFCTQVPSA